MNTMSTQKTNFYKNQTKQRCLDQPNITAPYFSTMEQVGSHHSLVLSIAERKDSWFLQCVISTLHHRPMFSTNCMWMCVYMSRAYIYIYIYIFLIAYVKFFKSVCLKTKPTQNLTLTLKSFCSRLFMTILDRRNTHIF